MQSVWGVRSVEFIGDNLSAINWAVVVDVGAYEGGEIGKYKIPKGHESEGMPKQSINEQKCLRWLNEGLDVSKEEAKAARRAAGKFRPGDQRKVVNREAL